jgi:FixJ family two-component response regulator
MGINVNGKARWTSEERFALLKHSVSIIDDDQEFRSALAQILRDAGRTVDVYASASDFWIEGLSRRPGIILLDLKMNEVDGLALQGRLVQRGDIRPIVFITAYADVGSAVESLKQGAVDYLVKPIREKALFTTIERAEALMRERESSYAVASAAELGYAKLSPREREVFAHIVQGKPNKQIARELGISEIMVKVHRGHVMDKMDAPSVPHLVRMYDVIQRSFEKGACPR